MDKTDAPGAGGLPTTDIDDWWAGLVTQFGRRQELPLDHVKFKTFIMERTVYVRELRDNKEPAVASMARVMAGPNDYDYDACFRLISRKLTGTTPHTKLSTFWSLAKVLISGLDDVTPPADGAREAGNRDLMDLIETLITVARPRTVAPEPPLAGHRPREAGPCSPALTSEETPEMANPRGTPTALARTEMDVERRWASPGGWFDVASAMSFTRCRNGEPSSEILYRTRKGQWVLRESDLDPPKETYRRVHVNDAVRWLIENGHDVAAAELEPESLKAMEY